MFVIRERLYVHPVYPNHKIAVKVIYPRHKTCFRNITANTINEQTTLQIKAAAAVVPMLIHKMFSHLTLYVT